MCPVQLTDNVRISYTVTLENGDLIEEAPENKPTLVAIGSGQLLLAAEACLFGMEPGETRSVNIQPEDAYGSYFAELVQDIPRQNFGDKINPEPGMILSLNVEEKGTTKQVPAMVLAATEETVTIDYNHPLAGKVLIYTMKLHEIL